MSDLYVSLVYMDDHATLPQPFIMPLIPIDSHDRYAYLLGLYLGDGCISRQGPEAKGV